MSDQLPPPPPPPPPPAYGPATPQPLSADDEKLWSILVHVGGILFGFLAPLIGYLVLKERGPFVRAHTATALNFQLTMLIGYLIGVVTSLLVIGIFILIGVWIATIVFGIIAAVAASQGKYYVYPIAIRFVN